MLRNLLFLKKFRERFSNKKKIQKTTFIRDKWNFLEVLICPKIHKVGKEKHKIIDENFVLFLKQTNFRF